MPEMAICRNCGNIARLVVAADGPEQLKTAKIRNHQSAGTQPKGTVTDGYGYGLVCAAYACHANMLFCLVIASPPHGAPRRRAPSTNSTVSIRGIGFRNSICHHRAVTPAGGSGGAIASIKLLVEKTKSSISHSVACA